jgi:methylmalonyl-CoA/ethylmalonyl-CoA epimerase
MQLRFSHVDVVVYDLDAAVDYYRRILGCTASPKKVWDRDGFHVEYRVLFNGNERFMLVRPIAGNLKTLMDEKGEGTIYRLCYTVPDVAAAYDELIAAGVQPENERGQPISKANLASPGGTPIIWLPKTFGNLSIELLEEASMESRMDELRRSAS